MLRGCAWAFAKARWDFFLPSLSQDDVRVCVIGLPIIGMITQDVMCLGSDWVTSEPDHSSIPPRRPGSSPCAKEVWAVPLQSRNSYHVDFSKEMHHIVVLSAAGTTKWWMEWLARKEYAHTHTLPPLLSLSPLTPNQSTHEVRMHTRLQWCGGHAGRETCELWRSAESLSRAVAIKQMHLQHERIPTIYKRKWKIRETMSEFCSPEWSVKPQVAAAAADPATLRLTLTLEWNVHPITIMSICLAPQTVFPDPH